MSQNKKYYFLKLDENFFSSNEIMVIEGLPEGMIYTNILLKLYLASLKYNGYLMMNEDVPCDLYMLASITRHQIGTVKNAVELFIKMHIITETDNAMYMTNIESMVGKSSTEADRKRIARAKIKAETKALTEGMDKCPQNVRTLSEKYPPEIEIEKELEKDIDIELEREIYGAYQNVRLTRSEYNLLKKDYPLYADEYIERLSKYMHSKGKGYANHYETIKSWIDKDHPKKNYDCNEEDSL